MNINLAQIAQWIDAKIEGNEDMEITGLAKIEEAQSGHLSFIANPKYAKYIETTNASAVLVDVDFPETNKTVLRVSNPYFAFLKLAQKFYQQAPQVESGIHDTAIIGEGSLVGEDCSIGAYVVIGKNCQIGKGTTIFPGTFIGDRVTIGENCLVYPNVSIREECQIGNNCILHMGAVVGSDGFGYAFEGGQFHKLPQMGIVVLEDDVEIGANITIDRATMGETRIQKGVKLDNLVQIAHNVQIGQHTALAAQAGVSGSSKIGAYVQIGGQAGIAGHLTVGDQAKVGGQAGVTKSIPDGAFYSGYPARPFRQEMREHAGLAKLPGMLKRFRELEAKVQELEAQLKELTNE